MSADTLHLANLGLHARLGVTETERAAPQRLAVFVTLHPAQAFDALGDDLANTVNYSAVAETLRAVAAEHPRLLLETLAADLAAGVLAAYPACLSVDVELRKFVLTDTDFVAARLSRSRGPALH